MATKRHEKAQRDKIMWGKIMKTNLAAPERKERKRSASSRQRLRGGTAGGETVTWVTRVASLHWVVGDGERVFHGGLVFRFHQIYFCLHLYRFTNRVKCFTNRKTF